MGTLAIWTSAASANAEGRRMSADSWWSDGCRPLSLSKENPTIGSKRTTAPPVGHGRSARFSIDTSFESVGFLTFCIRASAGAVGA